jgi:hypothetical protein
LNQTVEKGSRVGHKLPRFRKFGAVREFALNQMHPTAAAFRASSAPLHNASDLTNCKPKVALTPAGFGKREALAKGERTAAREDFRTARELGRSIDWRCGRAAQRRRREAAPLLN